MRTMRIDILTIFPDLFNTFLSTSIVGRAIASEKLRVNVKDLREFTSDKHRTVDDIPFGGGSGMVMKPEPIFRAVRAIDPNHQSRIILLSPKGRTFSQEMAERLAKEEWLFLICGRYEGVDERVREFLIDEEISIGDYILIGGEVPAMVIIEAVVRLIPGVIKSASLEEESFKKGLLEYPSYTRPQNFEGMSVPEVLISGDHSKIRAWRRRKSIEITLKNRPDLLKKARLDEEDMKILQGILKECPKNER